MSAFWPDRPEPLVIPGGSVLDFLHHGAGCFVGKPTIHEEEDRGGFEVFVEKVFDGLDCVLHVCIFAQSANYTRIISHFLQLIFTYLRNSLNESEQEDSDQRSFFAWLIQVVRLKKEASAKVCSLRSHNTFPLFLSRCLSFRVLWRRRASFRFP